MTDVLDNDISKKDISFQILDWVDYNIEDIFDDGNNEEEADNDEAELKTLNKFGLRLFGLTPDNNTICCTVKDYSPYFYIKLENGLANNVNTILEQIKERVYPKQNVDGLKSFKVIKKYDFSEFSNFTKFDFLMLNFYNVDSMRSYANALKRK